MSKKEIAAIVASILLVAGLTYLTYFYKKCKQPNDEVIFTNYVSCLADLNLEEVRELTCKMLQRSEDANCPLTSDDTPYIQNAIDQLLMKCIATNLTKNNYCTNKLKGLNEQ